MKSSAGRSKAGKGDDPPRRRTSATKGPEASAGSERPERPAPRAKSARPAARLGGRLDALALIESADRGEFPPATYLEGACEPVKAATLAALRAAWAKACPESPLARVFRAAETGIEELAAAWQGASLFSPRDLVIVLEIEDWGRSEKRVAALAETIARSATPSSLVLVESAGDTLRKSLEPLRQACRARVTAGIPAAPELVRWGERRFTREGFEAERGVMSLLAESCEGDPLAFFSELDKLCVWAAREKHLSLKEAKSVLRPSVGAELVDYLMSVAAGQTSVATRRLGRLLASGVNEGAIVFALSSFVGGALGGWTRYTEQAATLRRRAHPVQLSRALDAVYRAESAWKGGRADAVAVLEQVTRALCGGEAQR